MTTYILLRDNKESTPLTLPDLKNLGLRPTDLIWVEGQSVCWMHPGQVKELKDVGIPEQQEPDEAPVKTELPQESIANQKVFVAMPEKPEPKVISFPLKSLTAKENPVSKTEPDFPVAETKHSKPLNEIKELYPENLENRNRQSKNHFLIPPQLKRAAVYFILFITGIAAGIIISRSLTKSEVLAQSDAQRTAGAEIIQNNSEPEDSSLITNSTTNEGPSTIDNSIQSHTTSNKATPNIMKGISAVNESLAVNTQVLPVPNPTEPVSEENKPEEVKEVRKASIKELYSQISVKNNDYSVGSFGGIKNLELTLNNHSRYGLDEVEVQVQYLKPGDELIKTETVSFNNIGAGESRTIPVKKTNRGVKVNLKVSNIKSGDFLNSTALN